MSSLTDFLLAETKGLIVVGVTVLVLIIILGKLGSNIIKRILKGLFASIAISAILYFLVGMNLETVGIIGIVIFLLTAIFGKVSAG